MSKTESKSWITSKTTAIAARIPHSLHEQIETYGRENYPSERDSGYDKTATLIDLLSKGLGLDGTNPPSVNQSDVEQLVKQLVEQELSDGNVMQDVKQRESETSLKLEELVASIDALSQRLEALEAAAAANLVDVPVEPDESESVEGITSQSLAPIFEEPDSEVGEKETPKNVERGSSKGLTGAELSELTGMPPTTISYRKRHGKEVNGYKCSGSERDALWYLES